MDSLSTRGGAQTPGSQGPRTYRSASVHAGVARKQGDIPSVWGCSANRTRTSPCGGDPPKSTDRAAGHEIAGPWEDEISHAETGDATWPRSMIPVAGIVPPPSSALVSCLESDTEYLQADPVDTKECIMVAAREGGQHSGGCAHGLAHGKYARTATHKSRGEPTPFPLAKSKDEIQSWELLAGRCSPARLEGAKRSCTKR